VTRRLSASRRPVPLRVQENGHGYVIGIVSGFDAVKGRSD